MFTINYDTTRCHKSEDRNYDTTRCYKSDGPQLWYYTVSQIRRPQLWDYRVSQIRGPQLRFIIIINNIVRICLRYVILRISIELLFINKKQVVRRLSLTFCIVKIKANRIVRRFGDEFLLYLIQVTESGSTPLGLTFCNVLHSYNSVGLRLIDQLRNSPYFMEPQGSLLYSQKSITRLYPAPFESSSRK
jgi:hypothetical protein